MTPQTIIQPHGGTLIDRMLTGTAAADARATAASAPRVTLSEVGMADLEMIATGAYSPLTGFLGQADYTRVVNEMRLADGTLWSIPITLPVSESRAEMLRDGQPVGLYAPDGRLVGLLELRERYTYDQRHEAELVYRTTAPEHPGVARLYSQGPVLLGGWNSPPARSPSWRLRRPPAARPSPSAAGRRSSASRPATPCIAHTNTSRNRRLRSSTACFCTRWLAPPRMTMCPRRRASNPTRCC